MCPKRGSQGIWDHLGVCSLVCLLPKLPQPQGRGTEMPHLGMACLRMFFSVEPKDQEASFLCGEMPFYLEGSQERRLVVGV